MSALGQVGPSGSSGGENDIPPIPHQGTIALTNAQIIASPSGAIDLIAAPGSNKILNLASVFLNLHLVADYATVSVNSSLEVYWGASGVLASLPVLNEGFFNGGAPIDLVGWILPRFQMSGGNPIAAVGFPRADITNQPLSLVITNVDGNFTGGDAANTLTISTVYYILDTVTGTYL